MATNKQEVASQQEEVVITMRLTLRTLLAYMDDILDPADREELSTKIGSSEFANDLIHRTHDTMRRLRLSAPQPLGIGMALDPNTVAEYLDNVLPPDHVGDLERICLESDVHLAEVASGHHVLTMVLGEPAAIDANARQRMYGIASEVEQRRHLRIEPAHVPFRADKEEQETIGTDADDEAGAVPFSPPPAAVPDYLRTSAWARYRGTLTLVAAVLLITATVFFAFGLKGWFEEGPSSTVASNQNGEDAMPPTMAGSESDSLVPPPNDQPALGMETGGDQGVDPAGVAASHDAATAERSGSLPDSAPRPLLTPGITPQPSAAPEAVGPNGELSTGLSQTPQDAAPVAETPSEPVDRYAMSAAPSNATAQDEGPPSLRPLAAPLEEAEGMSEPELPGAADAEPRVASIPSGMPAPPSPDGNTQASPDATGATEEVETSLGTYLGGKTVLLRYDDATRSWLRLAPRTTVDVGDELLALPTFRPRITLASGVSLELVGGTLVKLATTDTADEGSFSADSRVPVVEIVYGRVVLVNVMPAEESHVRLALGATAGDVQLAPNATLAVAVERQYVPGRDPRQSPAPVLASLYAPDGDVVWTDEAGIRQLDKPGRWSVADGIASEVTADDPSPTWIDHDPVELLSEQRHGAPIVEQSLVPNQPVGSQMLELFHGSSRREVKSLVARCSVHVGLFVPFVEALRDSEQKSVWKMHIETLRSAMALSPDSAERIWQTLVDQRGNKAAADLFEMLCGYDEQDIGQTQEAMEVGAIARLIDRLENTNLDYRVLAVHDLREITGKTLMPNPAGSPNEREQGIRHWRTRLKAGELRPQTQP